LLVNFPEEKHAASKIPLWEFKRVGIFSQCRDKDSIDIFWLSESLEESDNLSGLNVLA